LNADPAGLGRDFDPAGLGPDFDFGVARNALDLAAV